MKRKIILISTAVLLSFAGLAYGLSAYRSCPPEGTLKQNCPLAGTPECPFENASEGEIPSCCLKK